MKGIQQWEIALDLSLLLILTPAPLISITPQELPLQVLFLTSLPALMLVTFSGLLKNLLGFLARKRAKKRNLVTFLDAFVGNFFFLFLAKLSYGLSLFI